MSIPANGDEIHPGELRNTEEEAVRRFICGLIACALSVISTGMEAADKPVYYVYLAGPEVFLPEPVKAGQEKKAIIERLNAEHGWPFRLVGWYPLDNAIPDFKPDRDTGLRIYRANIAMMDKAHFIAANMVRFRGPGMDTGTAFEMGYMRGLGKPVFGYYESAPFYGKSEAAGLYSDNVALHYKLDVKNPRVDVHGQLVERFGMADNLMMIGALDDTGSTIQPTFEEAILRIAKSLK